MKDGRQHEVEQGDLANEAPLNAADHIHADVLGELLPAVNLQQSTVAAVQTNHERYEISYPVISGAHSATMLLVLLFPLAQIPFLLLHQTAAASLSSIAFPCFLVVGILLPLWFFLRLPAKIVMSENGISFSIHWYTLGKRRQRSWDDLHSVQLVYPGVAVPEDSPIVWRGEKRSLKAMLNVTKWSYPPWLMLDFSSGGTAKILINRLTRQQAQELFRGLETWNAPSKFASEVVNLERTLVLDTDEISSFTKIWEDQLNAQYISTNYVPLPTNYTFQNGAYKVLMELSAGGMSAVYLANNASGQKVVIKEAVAPPDSDERQRLKSRELFEREARLLMKLDHPQIAKVLDYFVERGRDYLVMEYVKGRTLKQLVKEEGKQKESQVLQWARQIAEIIGYLHAENPPILHRDLTPDNLILSEKGRIKLVDFGAASEFVGSATGTFIGKQCYIPPEQLRGKAVPESDYYALGGTIHFLLTGKDPVALCQSHPKESEPAISAKTDQLVADLTALEAAARPNDANVLARIEQLAPGAKKAHSGKSV